MNILKRMTSLYYDVITVSDLCFRLYKKNGGGANVIFGGLLPPSNLPWLRPGMCSTSSKGPFIHSVARQIAVANQVSVCIRELKSGLIDTPLDWLLRFACRAIYKMVLKFNLLSRFSLDALRKQRDR